MKRQFLFLVAVTGFSLTAAAEAITGPTLDLVRRHTLFSEYSDATTFLSNREPRYEKRGHNYQIIAEKRRQSFGDTQGWRVSQAHFLTDLRQEIELQTATYQGKHLRSMTQCVGQSVESGMTGKEFNCATASARVCEAVLRAYRTEFVNEDRDQVMEQTRACNGLITRYSKVIKAFGERVADNQGVAGAREQMVNDENDAVKSFANGLAGGAAYRFHNVSNFKNQEETDALARKLTSTALGIRQINSFIDLCVNHRNDFDPALTRDVGGSVPAQARPPGSR